MKIDPRVDAYLGKAAEFARPVLRHLRALVHAGCPDGAETIKWGRPMFLYRGQILCAMAAFKAHCSFSFWHADMAPLVATHGGSEEDASSGQFGRITSLADLPDDVTLRRYVAEAVRLNEAGEPACPRPKAASGRAEIPVPADFTALLDEHPAAAAAFEKFSPSHRREYLEWIVEAKRAETRAKRMATAVEWLAAGKPHHWRYTAVPTAPSVTR